MDQLQPSPGMGDSQEFSRSPSTLSKSLEPVRATKIHLYRNGDAFYPARQVILRQDFRNLDRALDYMSGEMRGYGAIRRLYTPKGGTRIRSLDQIADGSCLVVSRQEKFKKMKYAQITSIREREVQYSKYRAARPMKLRSPVKVFPRRHFIGVEKPKNVTFIKNGDLTGKQHRVLLTKRNTISWDQLCTILSDKLKMESAVRRIYTIAGDPVTGLDQIVSGASYVAVARIGFKEISYKPAPPMKLGSPRKVPLPPISKAKVRVRPRPPAKLPKGPRSSPQKVPSRSVSKPKPTVIESPEPAPIPYDPPTPEPAPEPSPEPAPAPEPEPVVEAPAREKTIVQPRVVPEVAPQSYMLKVLTADEEGAGTDAKVFVTIYGSKGSSPKLPLSDKVGRFLQGGSDVVAVQADPVGELQRIRIEQDNSGPSSAWKLVKVTVRDTVTDRVTYFHHNKWLADDRGDFLSVAEIEASDLAEPPVAAKDEAGAGGPAVDETGFAATENREAEAEDVEDSAETKVDEVQDLDGVKAEEIDDDDDEVADAAIEATSDHEDEIEDEAVAEVAEVAEPVDTAEGEVADPDAADDEVDDEVVAEDAGSDGADDDVADISDDEEEEEAKIADEADVVAEDAGSDGADDDAADSSDDEEEEEANVADEADAEPAGGSGDEDDAVSVAAVAEEVAEAKVGESKETAELSYDDDEVEDTTETTDGDGTEEDVKAEPAVEESKAAAAADDDDDDAVEDEVEDEAEADGEPVADAEVKDEVEVGDGVKDEVAADAQPAGDADADADPVPAVAENNGAQVTGLSDAEEVLRAAIADVQHGDLRECFSTADDGTNVASLTALAVAIAGKVPELSSIEDLQAAMSADAQEGVGGDGEEGTGGIKVEGFEEAQLLLASAFYVKTMKQAQVFAAEGGVIMMDLDTVKETVGKFSVFEPAEELVGDFAGLGDEGGKVSILEVAMWLANKRILPLLS